MTTDEALSFLRENQPLPPDVDLPEDLIGKYDEIRKYFIEHPDPRCIPLFLNSFGDGDGLGVYQLVEDVIARFSTEEVLPHLKEALSSPRRSVRYWNAEIASRVPSAELVPILANRAVDEDADIRMAAAIALAQIKDERARGILHHWLDTETDHHIRSVLSDLLANF